MGKADRSALRQHKPELADLDTRLEINDVTRHVFQVEGQARLPGQPLHYFILVQGRYLQNRPCARHINSQTHHRGQHQPPKQVPKPAMNCRHGALLYHSGVTP